MKDTHKPLFSEETNILFVTFSLWTDGVRMPTNGSVEPLRDFLVPRIRRLVLIDQLVPGSESVVAKYEEYSNGNPAPVFHQTPWWMRLMVPILRLQNTNGTRVTFKIRDFLSVIDWVIWDRKKFDYVIGLESINTLAAICLRSLGKVGKVVYYVSDYSPNRYTNSLFNTVYLWLDRFCAMHADYIWDVSLAIHKARIGAGLRPDTSAPVIHVANGVFPEQIQIQKDADIFPHALAYMGTMGPENGPDVAIAAVSKLRSKYPDISLHMIGGSEKSFAWLKPRIKKYRLEGIVTHHGFVPKSSDMAKIMSTCSIGLAPYRAFDGSARWYGDAGKIRAYCAAGLAIVSSQVPPLGAEVAKKGAALICQDTPDGFAKTIRSIFENPSLYMSLRKHAIQYARVNTWEQQFTHAFEEMRTYEN
jgi:glycosyltransferase involved in cell wall biosynthesis